MAAARVQRKGSGVTTGGTGGEGGGQVSATTFTATFDSTATAGNYLIFAFTTGIIGTLATITSVQDNTGDNWTQITVQSGTNHRTAMYYKVSDGDETSVTLTLSVANLCVYEFREYSGILGLDQYEQSTIQKASIMITGATAQPTYQDGMHLYWVACSDTDSKSNMEASIRTCRGEISNTGWVLHGARGYDTGTNGGVPSVDAAGGTRDNRNGTYTAVMCRGWMLEKISGTGSDKAHVSEAHDRSGLTGRFPIATIWRTTSNTTATENGSGSGAASVPSNGQATTTVSGTTLVISKPTCATGDVLIAFIQTTVGVPVTSGPTGWSTWGQDWTAQALSVDGGTFPAGDFGNLFNCQIWYRVVDGTEGSSFTWTVGSSSAKRGNIIAVRTTTAYSGTTWQTQAPVGHIHADDGGTAGYKMSSGRRDDPAQNCIMIVFVRETNAITSATGFTRVTWVGTTSAEVFYKSVATSGPWELRADANARPTGTISFAILGAVSGNDHWAWSEESQDSWLVIGGM